MAVKILTDSTSYINEALRKELAIEIVPLGVEFPTRSFKETDVDNDSFYKMMEAEGIPQSSQPSLGELCAAMEDAVKQGEPLLCIFISSEMSGTFATAHMAKEMVLQNYLDAEIEILDSRSNCMQLGFAALAAARAAKDDKTLAKVKQAAEENMKRSRFLFVPETLKYLEQGGRIGRAGAIIGNLLNIIPILTVEDGLTTVYKKVRTKHRAVSTIVEKVKADMEALGIGEIVIHHINCPEEAREVAAQLRHDAEIKIQAIGPVIGLHVGPGAIGVAYYTREEPV